MPNITISEEDLGFLKTLAHEMKTQNNRVTASPYYFVVRRRKRIVGLDPEYADETTFVRQDGGGTTYESRPKAIAAFLEEGMSESEAEQYADNSLHETGFKYAFEDENMFLTLEGLKDHMRLNAHNYSYGIDGDNYKDTDSVYSYVKHAFRNPELEQLFSVIQRLGAAAVFNL